MAVDPLAVGDLATVRIQQRGPGRERDDLAQNEALVIRDGNSGRYGRRREDELLAKAGRTEILVVRLPSASRNVFEASDRSASISTASLGAVLSSAWQSIASTHGSTKALHSRWRRVGLICGSPDRKRMLRA